MASIADIMTLLQSRDRVKDDYERQKYQRELENKARTAGVWRDIFGAGLSVGIAALTGGAGAAIVPAIMGGGKVASDFIGQGQTPSSGAGVDPALIDFILKRRNSSFLDPLQNPDILVMHQQGRY